MRLVKRVFSHKGLELFKRDRCVGARVALGFAVGTGVAVVASYHLQRVVRAQAVANVGHALAEVHMRFDKRLVHRATLDDVVADVVQDGQVRLGLEDQRVVGQLARTVGKSG